MASAFGPAQLALPPSHPKKPGGFVLHGASHFAQVFASRADTAAPPRPPQLL